jgi:phosphomannomutase
MRQVGAVIGGEGNGGVIYPRINFCRDSLVGMALILHLLAETGRTVTEILADLPRYRMIKERLECPSNKIGEILKMVRGEYAGHRMDLRDGVKVFFEDAWLSVRGSNTEPIIRLVVEARDEGRAREILDGVFERVARVLR